MFAVVCPLVSEADNRLRKISLSTFSIQNDRGVLINNKILQYYNTVCVFVFVCVSKKYRECVLLCACGFQRPFFFFNAGEFFKLHDWHSFLCMWKQLRPEGRRTLYDLKFSVSYTSPSVHLPVSQSSESKKERGSSLLGLCRWITGRAGCYLALHPRTKACY